MHYGFIPICNHINFATCSCCQRREAESRDAWQRASEAYSRNIREMRTYPPFLDEYPSPEIDSASKYLERRISYLESQLKMLKQLQLDNKKTPTE